MQGINILAYIESAGIRTHSNPLKKEINKQRISQEDSSHFML